MENICSICKPPFVSYCMVVQERSGSKATDNHELFKGNLAQQNTDEDISNIPSVPMYEEFLTNKKNNNSEETNDQVVNKEPPQAPVRRKKRKEKETFSSPGVNTLANY